jgi:predicted phosphodiesterase
LPDVGNLRAGSATPAEVTRIAVVPDWHQPLSDPKVTNCALGVLKELNPHVGVIIGDYGDFEALSGHERSKPDLVKLANEYRLLNHSLDALQNATPSTKWVYIEGNHERRAKRFMAEQGRLDGMLNVPVNLYIERKDENYFRDSGVALRGIEWVPYEKQPYFIGAHSAYYHGHHYSAQHHAYKHALVFSSSSCENRTVFYGHRHVYQAHRAENHCEAVCVGFLGDERALEYTNGRPTPWVTGLVYQEALGEHMDHSFVHIKKGSAIFKSKLIGS